MSVSRQCAQRLSAGAAPLIQAAGQFRAFSAQDAGPVYAIFGATGGIGSELARRLTKQPGANVMAAADTKESLGQLEGEIKDLHSVACDVLKRDTVAKVLGEAMDKFGRLDGVVNCTGNMTMKPAHLTGEEEFMEGLRINALSSLNVLAAAVEPMMKSGGGSIVLVSSSVAYRGYANHEATSAAKGAVNALALSAASSYAPHNIRVNVCSPGLIRTPMTERMTESKQAADLSARMHALGRIGESADVAAALEYLLHPSNSFVTGATLHVDGGLANVAPTNAAA